MAAADDLRLLVTGYTEMVVNLNIMLARLDAELAALAAEITTITDGAMAGALASHLARLEAKRVALGFVLVHTWGTYGTDNISDNWGIWAYNENPWTGNITRLSDDSFRHDGQSFPLYSAGRPILCGAGDVARIVLSQNYLPPEPGPDPPMASGWVIVTLEAGTALPNPLTSIDNSQYGYILDGAGWDSDAGIIADQIAFALGYDHINDPIDLSGTYGLLARIVNITTGYDVQVLNRDKYQEFVDYYEPYAAP
jgi:hypothetical protein